MTARLRGAAVSFTMLKKSQSARRNRSAEC
jgi:hypothetical protein